MSRFITNKENDLKTTVKELFKSSVGFDFLVGYFVFSGFKELYQDLDNDKPLKILVGMDIGWDVRNILFEHYKEIDDNFQISHKDNKKNYLEAISNFYSKSDAADNVDTQKSYEIFKKKLENGSLEVRKTQKPNHSKMYLFYSDFIDPIGKQPTGKVIVGSSNLSSDGLTNREEINVYLQDHSDYADAKRIFDELWESATQVISKDNKEEFYIKINNTWLESTPNPYLLYIRVLREYFKISDEDIKSPKELSSSNKNQYFDVKYQLDAISDGVSAVKKHSGCIIADVVGLGKSIVASCIAKNLELQKVVKRTIIICPPHLKLEWENYAKDFCLSGYDIYTSGKIKQCAEYYKKTGDLLVIIDEAHRYRNETRQDYEDLKALCLNNKVLLLSATPFNNRPQDIFSLVKLFQIPSYSTIKTVDNLANKMAELIREYKEIVKYSRKKDAEYSKIKSELKSLAGKIRSIIEPVVIRRTRVDLQEIPRYREDLQINNIEFSKVCDPVCENYELGNLSKLYVETLNTISPAGCSDEEDLQQEGFKGASYKPLLYLKPDKEIKAKYAEMFDMENFEEGQKNLALFMRRFLVRRFESSKFAFLKSINNVLCVMQRIADWYELGIIPFSEKEKILSVDILDNIDDDDSDDTDDGSLFGDVEECDKSKDDDIERFKNSLIKNGRKYIESSDLKKEFITDLKNDIELFSQLRDKWKDIEDDPKFDYINEKISKAIEKEPNRKIIVFTEFADTADYLSERFKFEKRKKAKVIEYSSKLASKAVKKTIKENFDAGFAIADQKDDFNVLIGTDAISEGMSLHRAGAIYNYDIPYNPTRVIQRIGRINRINRKVFDQLYIYNFFPTEVGERESGIKHISTFKMHLIQSIFGSDTKTLTSDESIDGYMIDQYRKKNEEDDSESWDVQYRKEFDKVEKKYKDEANKIPLKCKVARRGVKIENPHEDMDLFSGEKDKMVMLFSKKGDSCRFSFSNGIESGIMYPDQAIKLFKCSPDEKGFKISSGFWERYEQAKSSSGISKVTTNSNPKINAALAKIKQMLLREKENVERDYLSMLCEVIKLDVVSGSKLKKIGKISLKVGSVSKIKELVPLEFIEAIMKKKKSVENQPETILLSEELNIEE